MNLKNYLSAITVCMLMILPTTVRGWEHYYQTDGTHVIAGNKIKAQVYVPEKGLNLRATFDPNHISAIKRIRVEYDYSIQPIDAVLNADYWDVRGTIFFDLRGPSGPYHQDGQGHWVLKPNPDPNKTIHVDTHVNHGSTDVYRSLYIVLSNPSVVVSYRSPWSSGAIQYRNIAERGLPDNPNGKIVLQDKLGTGIPSILRFAGFIFKPKEEN